MSACDGCLRRAWLIGRLAARISGKLSGGAGEPSDVLALPDDVLIAELGGGRADEVHVEYEAFDPDHERDRVGGAALDATCQHDRLWPESLHALGSQEPAVLFHTCATARLAELLSDPAVAIVGSRDATPYGLDAAAALGRDCAVAGLTVVSGLALGVDAASHRGALDGRGKAIAVLAGGADVPYPRRHRALYERIREAGAVVSELPPGAAPRRWSFPARNRIMAALAEITVVVEAAEPSGTLITARVASRIGRPVGAVPGPITSRMSLGPNRLIADGATLVSGVGPILDEIYGVHNWAASPPAPGLTEAERAVLDAVESGRGPGEIARRELLPAAEVRATLARLELAGLVVSDGLGGYRRVLLGPAGLGMAGTG